jgi:hypothetical protein
MNPLLTNLENVVRCTLAHVCERKACMPAGAASLSVADPGLSCPPFQSLFNCLFPSVRRCSSAKVYCLCMLSDKV